MSSANLASTTVPLPARALSSRWRPSLTDVFFFAVIFTLFLSSATGWDRLVWDGDTGLHTRTGDYVLDTGTIPTTDPFSFSIPGKPWVALQWLTGVLFAALNRAMGLKGIVLLCGVAIALIAVVMLRNMLLRGADGLTSTVLVLIACNAMSIHFHARPHIFTLLFLAVTFYLLTRDMRERTRWFWAIVPLTMLWANMHAGFPVVLAALGLTGAGCAIRALFETRDWSAARRYFLAFGLCGAAALVNPHGFGLYTHIVAFVDNPWVLAHVHEYQPPTFQSEAMYYFLGILVLAAASIWPLARRRDWPAVLCILAFGAGSLISVRHVPVFVVVATPFVAAEASELLKRAVRKQGPKSVLGVIGDVAARIRELLRPVSVWSAGMVLAVGLFSTTFPTDLSAKYFPRAVVTRHADELATARVFTTDQWGDYLLWRNYPRQRVFIDGRFDYFLSLGDDYLTVLSGAGAWQEILDRYGVNLLLVPTDEPLAKTLETASGWTLVDKDKQAVLYRRAREMAADQRR